MLGRKRTENEKSNSYKRVADKICGGSQVYHGDSVERIRAVEIKCRPGYIDLVSKTDNA